MHQQAPWLYANFETLNQFPDTPHDPVRRPAFLPDEEGKDEGQKSEEVSKAKLVQRQEERIMLERLEREEMSRQLNLLAKENQKLREDLASTQNWSTSRDERGRNGRCSKEASRSADDGRKCKAERRSPSYMGQKIEKQEDDATFATPTGSTEADCPKVPNAWRDPAAEEKPDEPAPASEGTGKGRGTRKKKENENPQDTQQQTLAVILKLVEGMQDLQKKVLKSHRDEDSAEAELVRTSVELPKLQEWNAKTLPIDYADWLLLLYPIVADLSATSEIGGRRLFELQSCGMRPTCHMSNSPLERLSHKIVPTPALNQRKRGRLEKRASALLLAAIPSPLLEEVVAAKSISTLGHPGSWHGVVPARRPG